jgi:hypothetical protein
MLLTTPAQPRTAPNPATPLSPARALPTVPALPARRQFYWINKWRYERHVGLHACRADTGEYVGQIARIDYVVSGDSKQWVYSFKPRPISIYNDPPTRRDLERVLQAKPVPLRGAAADYTVTGGSCADGRPGRETPR